MKRVVFLIDKTKKSIVEKFLNEKGITFSHNDRFYFDIRTAVVTCIGTVLLVILLSKIF
jgi:hypothetical protein